MRVGCTGWCENWDYNYTLYFLTLLVHTLSSFCFFGSGMDKQIISYVFSINRIGLINRLSNGTKKLNESYKYGHVTDFLFCFFSLVREVTGLTLKDKPWYIGDLFLTHNYRRVTTQNSSIYEDKRTARLPSDTFYNQK